MNEKDDLQRTDEVGAKASTSVESKTDSLTLEDVESKTVKATVTAVRNTLGFSLDLVLDKQVYYQVRKYDEDTEEYLHTDEVGTSNIIRNIGSISVAGTDDACDAVDLIMADVAAYRAAHRHDADGKIPLMPSIMRLLLRGAKVEVSYYLRNIVDDDTEPVYELHPIVTLISGRPLTGLLAKEFERYQGEGLKPYCTKAQTTDAD